MFTGECIGGGQRQRIIIVRPCELAEQEQLDHIPLEMPVTPDPVLQLLLNLLISCLRVLSSRVLPKCKCSAPSDADTVKVAAGFYANRMPILVSFITA